MALIFPFCQLFFTKLRIVALMSQCVDRLSPPEAHESLGQKGESLIERHRARAPFETSPGLSIVLDISHRSRRRALLAGTTIRACGRPI
ncbi:MAG: hypothetical protein ACTHJR_17385 [Sphingomonas sp.]|uniref:hypothetical protein n=1 Tax=Sphingomonas sp. TaxID=28214 RepID=UPI003F7CD5A1